ncbi:methylated-DNA--[protein]-cysteine S-methyltransferase [Pseudidiomarina andamanensis]|uniref:Methylated-DNA--protein-cysteine methyltransferase n=1 Tax=Pseudidiomarina andamanensis TaxID=1940690 RepID=A0AA92EVH8_9GAMM|nr:methylated-DNA--[protein]-cysteine S-methyltransferase [Pseudidiomarina andamanensis]MDS0219226.1 methylated-DNA--[protein]-cysteine S-methyltransferase [Pseudidiomarina andamanensis]QGT95965.1 methylated-DNA--[protein]-cysteine S-methyltransferase [Pseudidiomarina andamanensis]
MYQDSFESPIGPVTISSRDGESICEIAFAEPDGYPSCNVTRIGKQQLIEYFNRKRKRFNLPLKPEGTEFQHRVWKQLATLEYGQLASYRDIAIAIDNPKGNRAVGMANSRNPIAIVVPCHRVVGADGSITGYAGGIEKKAFLLYHEGAVFD